MALDRIMEVEAVAAAGGGWMLPAFATFLSPVKLPSIWAQCAVAGCEPIQN